MPDFLSLHPASLLATLALLGGCSLNGNYPDAPEPDAAKLRFISSIENSTLTLFDAQHCGGQMTGLLNNLFTRDTQRRVGMSVAPPANAKGYLEIRLKPATEVFMQTNTVSTGSVCSVYFNFIPQAGSEYEVSFDYIGNQCQATLSLLRQEGGKAIRAPLPLYNKGLPACAGSSPIFPQMAAPLPNSPERATIIEQIVTGSIIPEMRPTPSDVSPEERTKALNRMVEERKDRVGISLPDAYWDEYRQDLTLSLDEAAQFKQHVFQLYTDEYHGRLSRIETSELRRLLPDSATLDESRALAVNNSMLEFYYHVRSQVMKESVSKSLARLADLDRRYAVCDRYRGCWRN